MSKKNIKIMMAGVLLLGIASSGLVGWYAEHQHVRELESLVDSLQMKERRSAVTRSISKQMEEIAFQQKAISDEQREEAIQQKQTADDMRLRSEEERKKAIIAQNNAIASEQQAQEARKFAESERLMAEHQRIQAEFSKRVADTLSYIALSRSLGSMSSFQSQLGDTQLANLLAYASYCYTHRYGGDVYYPSVFSSLMTASQSKRTWARHKGTVMGIVNMPGRDDFIVSVSSYGEIFIHNREDDQLKSEMLLSNSSYDFRDVYVDSHSTIYAISRSGHLAIIEGKVAKVLLINNLDNPMAISELDSNNILLIGENGLAQYDKKRETVVATRELDFKVTACSRYNFKPLIFDDKGRQHTVTDINNLLTSNVPVQGHVTAFASSKNTHQRSYGMSDGTIYLYNENTGKVLKLQGHLSRISKMKFNGFRLYSSSYDGSVNLWNTDSEKTDPMTLLTAGSWIMDLCFDSAKKHVWIGDQNGNVTEALLSVSEMANITQGKLKRDFTSEEWNFYIGKKVPYESFVVKKH